MRDLILKMSISIDGFVAGAAGEIGWMFGRDQEAKAWSVEAVSKAGLHIMGSRTFRTMAAFWPTSTDPFAPAMNQIPKAVFSRQGQVILSSMGAAAPPRAGAASASPTELQPGARTWTEAYVASGELAQEVARLKAQAGGPIIAHGGASFARSLVAYGLVDEFALHVHPIALGNGLSIFSDLSAPMTLKLVRAINFPGGSLAHIYRPA